jgi:hypothetical protein
LARRGRNGLALRRREKLRHLQLRRRLLRHGHGARRLRGLCRAGKDRSENAEGERNERAAMHVISFLPPGPGSFRRISLAPTGVPGPREHVDFQSFRGFFRARGINPKETLTLGTSRPPLRRGAEGRPGCFAPMGLCDDHAANRLQGHPPREVQHLLGLAKLCDLVRSCARSVSLSPSSLCQTWAFVYHQSNR